MTFGEPAIAPDDFVLRSDHGSVYTGADCEQLGDEWKVRHKSVTTCRRKHCQARMSARDDPPPSLQLPHSR